MNNEEAHKKARESVISLKCPFERALLSNCINCSGARRLLLAEREAITCSERDVNGACHAFHAALHRTARFALRVSPDAPWPFGKEIRAQCGGMRGLKAVLGHDDKDEIDAAGLLKEGLQRYRSIENLPYSEIMRGVVHYEPRKRRL